MAMVVEMEMEMEIEIGSRAVFLGGGSLLRPLVTPFLVTGRLFISGCLHKSCSI